MSTTDKQRTGKTGLLRLILGPFAVVAAFYVLFFWLDKAVKLPDGIKILAFLLTLAAWIGFEVSLRFSKSRSLVLKLVSNRIIAEKDIQARIKIFRLGILLTLLIIPLSWASSTLTPPSTYTMILLDASSNMQDSFDGRTKWDAALDSVNIILDGLNPRSNYGLVVVGGSGESGGADPCEEPSSPSVPFVSDAGVLLLPGSYELEDVRSRIGQLQPSGGGSFYTAFSLAHNQLQDVRSSSSNITKTLIFITGSRDTCEVRDEWEDLKKLMQIVNDVEIYSEIIILDENAGITTRSFAEYINGLSEKANVQVPHNNSEVQRFSSVVVRQVNIHENYEPTVTFTPSLTPTPRTYHPAATATYTFTPEFNIPLPSLTFSPSYTPEITNTVSATPPPPVPTMTWTPPIAPTTTSTQTFTPIPPVDTPEPVVELLSFSYSGISPPCDAWITFQVTGSTVTGNFHAWNASFGPPGDTYPTMIFPVGLNSYKVGLGGQEPQYYYHEVWFEYNGKSSNRLTGLICPGATPLPPP